MRVVLDASVVLKWFFKSNEEPDIEIALALMERFADGRMTVIQPPHFLAEVCAVLLARRRPPRLEQDLADLQAMEWQTSDHPALYERASELAVGLDHHVFDTLYHATALLEDAVFITADIRYANKARPTGALQRLDEGLP